MFILQGVQHTSYQTIRLIHEMKLIMQKHKQAIRTELKSIYSQDLLNILFSHPYTKIVHIEHGLNITRPTATKYLEAVVAIGLMKKN